MKEKKTSPCATPVPSPVMASIVIILPVVYLFCFMGNTQEPDVFGPSAASWLVHQWLDPRSEVSHGPLIPVVSLYFVWQARRELIRSIRGSDASALWWIIGCLVVYWVGYRAQQPRGGVIALIGLTWAIPYYLWGKVVARKLLFPCAYLSFAIPLGFLSAFSVPLRRMSCSAAVCLANGLGFSVSRIGTGIHSLTGQFPPLDVADPCSGLNSIIALSALTAAYSYLTQKSFLGKWLLFICSVPLAMIGNVARITIIVAGAAVSGSQAAMKVSHDYSGYIVFITGVLLMTATGSILNRLMREKGVAI